MRFCSVIGWSRSSLRLRHRLGSCRPAGSGKGINARAALAAVITPVVTAIPARTTALGGLGALLLDHSVKLALFEQLGGGAQGKTQGRHGGAQAEGLLHGPGCPHLVVAQADAKTTRLAPTIAPAVPPPGGPAGATPLKGTLL
jgi:hypothetical protein